MAADRAEIRRLLLRAHKMADGCMKSIREANPLTYPFLYEQVCQYILMKFLLTEEDMPEDGSFAELTERSLARSMNVHPSLVEEFDTAQSCDGATSAMAKKVLLFMSIQRALSIELPAMRSARVKTMGDVVGMIWDTLKQQPEWAAKMTE